MGSDERYSTQNFMIWLTTLFLDTFVIAMYSISSCQHSVADLCSAQQGMAPPPAVPQDLAARARRAHQVLGQHIRRYERLKEISRVAFNFLSGFAVGLLVLLVLIYLLPQHADDAGECRSLLGLDLQANQVQAWFRTLLGYGIIIKVYFYKR